MLKLLWALLLHPTSILLARVGGLFFVSIVAIAIRLPTQTVPALIGLSQLQAILVSAALAFVLQIYAIISDHFSRDAIPTIALQALCTEVYKVCCLQKSYVLGLRVTAFRPKYTWVGRRLVSVCRVFHGEGPKRSGIKFKIGEGTVGMAYASNAVVAKGGFPEPTANREAYYDRLCNDCSIARKAVTKMHVLSRSFVSIPIRYFDDRTWAAAVISIDSMDPGELPPGTQRRALAWVDAAMVLFHKKL